MDSTHLEQLKKLCETLPEEDLVRMKNGLDKFFQKNPMTDGVRNELSRIKGKYMGGDSNDELIQYGIGSLIIVVSIGLIGWYLMNVKAANDKLMGYNYVHCGNDVNLAIILKYPDDQAPGIVNKFTLDQLEQTPKTNYSRHNGDPESLIKPWLLSEAYPNQAVFVGLKPFEWFRGGGSEEIDWDKTLVLPDLAEVSAKTYDIFVNKYKMPIWYDNYKTAICFNSIVDTSDKMYDTELLTDDNLKDIIEKLNSAQTRLVNLTDNNMLLYNFIKDLVYMPLKKNPSKGHNLFISCEYYKYHNNNYSYGSHDDEQWATIINKIKKYWEERKH
jgi:hypothetical protein